MSKKKMASTLLSERHEAALEEYEKGIRLLQQKDYSKAILRFESVINDFPGEAALGDRSRTYLSIAKGEGGGRKPQIDSKEPEKAYEIGVYLLNDGQFTEALKHLERAAEHDGSNEGVLIALASAQLQSGDRAAALSTLDRALEGQPDTRYRVRGMSDFQSLAQDEDFRRKFLEA